MGICISSHATTNITGYYQSKSEKPLGFRELCISSNYNKLYHIDLFTSYCPSKECMNARMDEVHFDASFKNNKLKYKTTRCEITIYISQGRAVIKQKLDGCGIDKQLLDSGGKYKLIRRNLNENDCSPRSS
jgi:hypothetical protein